jgi:hypothetical protein
MFLSCITTNTGTDMSDPLLNAGFTPNADAAKAHHMLLYGCQQPLQPPGEVPANIVNSTFHKFSPAQLLR